MAPIPEARPAAVPSVAMERADTLEDAVIWAVAGLLDAADDAALVEALVTLVRRCGGEVAVDGRAPQETLRTLPDALRAPGGRQLTLGPVLRALCAAARERASGGLAPPRAGTPRPAEADAAERGPRDVLVSLDLGDVGQVRARLGDPGARWLVTKLQRTLRSLLQSDDRALRYPAGRILVLMRGAGLDQAQALTDRLSLEWDAYLGRRGQVVSRQVLVVDGDLAAALRTVG